jgi:hypothetical protein
MSRLLVPYSGARGRPGRSWAVSGAPWWLQQGADQGRWPDEPSGTLAPQTPAQALFLSFALCARGVVDGEGGARSLHRTNPLRPAGPARGRRSP